MARITGIEAQAELIVRQIQQGLPPREIVESFNRQDQFVAGESRGVAALSPRVDARMFRDDASSFTGNRAEATVEVLKRLPPELAGLVLARLTKDVASREMPRRG